MQVNNHPGPWRPLGRCADIVSLMTQPTPSLAVMARSEVALPRLIRISFRSFFSRCPSVLVAATG